MNEPTKQVQKVVRVEDLATTVRLKKVQAKADLEARKAEQTAEAEVRKLQAQAKAAQAKAEIQRMKLSMSAREAAQRHLAHFAGLYLFLSVIAFLYAVATLPADIVAVVAGLITLVVTTIGGLLRSIVEDHKIRTPPEED
jgi:regulator of protease activity HflC (stomatin/prohibitin superfamily)